MTQSYVIQGKRTSLAGCTIAAAVVGLLLLFAPGAWAAGYTSAGTGDSPFQMSNGQKTVYMEYAATKNTLYIKTNATGAVKKLRAFKHGADDSWNLDYVYKDIVFVTHNSFEKWRNDEYAYNMKTKKLKKVKGNCTIAASNGGAYVVASNTYRTDVGPSQYTLYKVNKSGAMKKVKVLVKNGMSPTMVGKYIYYGSGNSKLSKMSIYRCKANGTAVKKLGGPWKGAVTPYGFRELVLPTHFTSKDCLITFSGSNSTNYLYTYKTKQLEPISADRYYEILLS